MGTQQGFLSLASEAENKGNELHGLWDTLFPSELSLQKKESILYNDYHIETTDKQKETVESLPSLYEQVQLEPNQ